MRILTSLMTAALATASGVARADDVCVNSTGCPGWQICSTELGDCESGWGSLEVCTGHCRDGWLHISLRAETVVIAADDIDAAAAFSVEVIPPWLRGRLSVAADWWTENVWRLGAALWLRPHPAFAVGPRIDAIHAEGDWAPAAAVRGEWSPIWPFPHLGWSPHISVVTEVGVIADDHQTVFASLGFAGWLSLP